jgi:hypothetical protein
MSPKIAMWKSEERHLFLYVIRPEFAGAGQLNYHGAVLRRHEMWDAGRNNDESARRVALQLSIVESLALAQIPSPFDDRDQFVVWVRIRRDMTTARYLDPIDPRPASAGIAQQVRTLSPVFVVGRGEPPNLIRSNRDDLFLVLAGPRPCQDYANNHCGSTSYKKQPFHLALFSTRN